MEIILLIAFIISFFIPVKVVYELKEYNKGTLAESYDYIGYYYNIYGIKIFSIK